MQKNYLLFILTFLLACNGHKTRQDAAQPTNNNHHPAPVNSFRFDSTAEVNGCADVLLQKISKDLQSELLIELQFDSIPKFKEIRIADYSKFVHIVFNKYATGNKYVDPICNDAKYFPKGWKQPNTYTAVEGNLMINYWEEKEHLVSALVKNLVVEDSAKNKITIPMEFFDRLRVYTYGG
jgi:hypothetical protein